jgi:hypothetical protein
LPREEVPTARLLFRRPFGAFGNEQFNEIMDDVIAFDEHPSTFNVLCIACWKLTWAKVNYRHCPLHSNPLLALIEDECFCGSMPFFDVEIEAGQPVVRGAASLDMTRAQLILTWTEKSHAGFAP